MAKTKSTNKKRSEAMKKRWAEKKYKQQTKVVTDDPTLANAVNSSFSGQAVQAETHIKRSNYFNIRIERPDGTVISLTND